MQKTTPKMPEEATKVLEAMKNTDGERHEKMSVRLDGIDTVRFDLLHTYNMKAYDNMIEEKKKVEDRVKEIDKYLETNKQFGFY